MSRNQSSSKTEIPSNNLKQKLYIHLGFADWHTSIPLAASAL